MRSKTETMHHTLNAVNRENWRGITYAVIDEYDALPKVDRREYVLRLVAANQKIKEVMEGFAKQASETINKEVAKKETMRRELERLQNKWYVKLFKKLGL